jgi:hypothetical protein
LSHSRAKSPQIYKKLALYADFRGLFSAKRRKQFKIQNSKFKMRLTRKKIKPALQNLRKKGDAAAEG